MRARHGDGTGRRRLGRAGAGLAVAAAVALGGAGVAGAQQHGGAGGQEQNCRALGGSWRPTVYGGIDGFGCRIDVFYGCGVDLVYDANGNPLGGDAWCLGGNVSW